MSTQTDTGQTTTARPDASRAAAARAALIDTLDVVGQDPIERFERIVRTAREVFGVPLSFLNLVGDEDRLHVLTERGDGGPRTTSADASFCQYTVQQSDPLVIPDAVADPRYASLPAVTQHGIRFYAGVPLTMPGGVRIGSLCVMDTEPRTLTLEERATLVDLTHWAERVLADGLQRERVADVVRAMSPEPVDVPGYAVAGLGIPAAGVGGDVHDWALLDGALTVSVADVLGEGTAASILAAGLRGALRARTGLPPVEAVAALEAQVGGELARAQSFAATFHARLDTASGEVEIVDAGHGMVLHLAADGTQELVRSTDLPIGLHPRGVARTPQRRTLAPGDALVVATDGVLELGDGTLDTMLVLGRRLHATRDAAGAVDVDGFLSGVAARASERAEDDVTVVVVARR